VGAARERGETRSVLRLKMRLWVQKTALVVNLRDREVADLDGSALREEERRRVEKFSEVRLLLSGRDDDDGGCGPARGAGLAEVRAADVLVLDAPDHVVDASMQVLE
jgi:hypothetical protein